MIQLAVGGRWSRLKGRAELIEIYDIHGWEYPECWFGKKRRKRYFKIDKKAVPVEWYDERAREIVPNGMSGKARVRGWTVKVRKTHRDEFARWLECVDASWTNRLDRDVNTTKYDLEDRTVIQGIPTEWLKVKKVRDELMSGFFEDKPIDWLENI